MATYGTFPGVKVTTESGGITNVAIGEEEKLVFFGEASYTTNDSDDGLIVEGDDATLDVNANEPEQINAPRVADLKFGDGSELAEAMKESLGNGANIDFLYGVPVQRKAVTSADQERKTTTTGTGDPGETSALNHAAIVESTGAPVDFSRDTDLNSTPDTLEGDFGIEVIEDPDGAATELTVEFRYNGAPNAPTADSEEVYINPLTGEWAADPNTVTPIEFRYTYNDYASAFQASGPQNVVNEDETGIFFALTDSDLVSIDLNNVVGNLRNDYQLVKALSFAEPNATELLDANNTTDANGGADARYDPGNYDSANSSVKKEYFYKFAPARQENADTTIGGGLGGLFAGNALNDPIYNESISGYQSLEQQFSKSDADNMRDPDNDAPAIIPVRSGGAVRVKGNRSTAYHEADAVAADFWTRRITDRVILIGKQIGDSIIGRINDEETRNAAERRIGQEMRQLADDRLIRSNSGEDQNWTVTAYEDPTNDDQVNIDIAFSPYGIVKRVDETITVNAN